MTPSLEAPPRPPSARRVNGQTPPPPRPDDGDGDGEERGPRRGLDNLRLAILFFMGAEAMFFGALISALLVLRLGMAAWPPPLEPRLPVAVTGLNTVVLLASSVALVAAARARRRGDRDALLRRLAVTAGLGALFLAIQGYEWVQLIGFGLSLAGVYGTTFFALIGTHAAHVVGALIWLLVTTALVARGRLLDPRGSALPACAMYWHFVVGVWPVLYVAVYLL
jgi:heme/copper-type cytochrome/quinol oxidase subunit 3